MFAGAGFLRFSVILLLVLSCVACADKSLETPAFHESSLQFKKLLVVVGFLEDQQEQAKGLEEKLSSALRRCGKDAEVFNSIAKPITMFPDNETLDERKELKEKIRSYKPDAILNIEERQHHRMGAVFSDFYKIQLFDTSIRKSIWDGMGQADLNNFDTAASTVLQGMAQDRIISPACIADKK